VLAGHMSFHLRNLPFVEGEINLYLDLIPKSIGRLLRLRQRYNPRENDESQGLVIEHYRTQFVEIRGLFEVMMMTLMDRLEDRVVLFLEYGVLLDDEKHRVGSLNFVSFAGEWKVDNRLLPMRTENSNRLDLCDVWLC